eukprot:Skav203235  [mRNA]  locus=scaffold438:183565:184906:+ [translate_table: standard]
MDVYPTYRRCTLRSSYLARFYWGLTGSVALFVLGSAVIYKGHLLQEVFSRDVILFARFKEEPNKRPKCSAMNATGLCVELPWLDAVDVSASRGFLATYVEENLHLGRPSLQRLGDPKADTTRPRKVHSQSFYVAQPEQWSLVLEDRLTSIAGTWMLQDLEGFLRKEQLERSEAIEYVRHGVPKEASLRFGGDRSDRRLKVSMSDLLRAANDITFELRVQAHEPLEGVRTIRSIGVAQSFIDPNATGGDPSAHVTRRSFGVRLLFHHQGIIGRWDPMTLVFFLLQCCGQFTVAWTLTELLCTFIPFFCELRGHPAPEWFEALQRVTHEKKE